MGEIKSVKVDNWGVFFLQKLQNFFNKTDYCDLTLQFRDNSQLKVHRLVLSACTDYFNVLEQTCEVVDDAIIMPNGLQADVVVPIVNFMYTGTLEFELKMYNRLLRTAKDMNMTVLLKLLEAHRRTMEMHPQKSVGPASPKPRRKTAAQAAAPTGRSLIQTNQVKRLVVGSNTNAAQQRSVSTGNTLTRLPTAGQLPVRQIGSTTFTRIKVENDQQETHTSTGGYTLLKQSPQQQHTQQPTSPFEQLRKGYNNNKRPAVSTFVSPPAKKPNLEDVKEFAEQQRMRKQIAAEYGDDDYDASNIMDDDTIHNDDDDDEMMAAVSQTPQTPATSASAGVQTMTSQNQQQQSEDPPGTTTIIVKHEGPDKPPTIVVKDNGNSKMNHAKIISEVLRQYPHLVKTNKNIKLKIMPNAGGQAQKIIVKKEPMEPEKPMQPPPIKLPTGPKMSDSTHQQPSKSLAATIVANRPKTLQQQQQQAEITSAKPTQSATNKTSAASSNAPAATGQPQKRRIDSKTMHALIALGAENTTGPWLCLRCGRNGHPISIPSYRGFRRHLINTHKEVIDAALCEHCGWRSASKRELHFHMQLEHKVKTNLYIFPECQLCQQMCIDSDGLNQHLIDSHPDENKQQCIYCNKIFPEEIQLYTHMKTFHKKQALEDGIIDYSDDENPAQATLTLPPAESEQEIEVEHKQHQHQQKHEKKINILSDISLPIASSIIKTDSFVQQHELTTSTASEEYLQDQEHEHEHTETKFVAADGSEVILTAEQRKEILSQLNQEHEGSGVVMVVNENPQQSQYGSGETQSDQGAISHDETSQATTVTNEERPEEEEEEEQVAEEEDDQHDDNQIYNEMKAMHSNLEEDSTSQTEAAADAEEASLHEEEHEQELEQEEEDAATEHEQRPEHLDESKESVDNLEWAENLLSEHDLADEVLSSQATNEQTQSNKPEEKEEEIKDDDNKSQDEISKKLKELTGDWSEDDDEDMPEEDPLTEISPTKEIAKEKPEVQEKEAETETLAKEQQENPELEDHAELLASLQSTDKDELEEHKEITTSAELQAAVEDCENIDEDDIDMALKSLHKEDIEEEDIKTEDTVEEPPEKVENEEKDIEATIESAEEVVEKLADVVAEELGKQDTKLKEVEVKADIKKETKHLETDNEDKPEENLVKELETLEEPEATTCTMVVDEKTKKDLIESLLSEQAETMEDTAIETAATNAVVKIEKEVDRVLADTSDTTAKTDTETEVIKTETMENTPSLEDEFLNITTDKTTAKETSNDNAVTTTTVSSSTTSTTATEAVTTTEVAEASSTSVKKEATISSEERVKSLISEWGDDDEDEEDNDTDLTANL